MRLSHNKQMQQASSKEVQDWVGKVILWELSKRLKFVHSTKWYMHNLESVFTNETHKILWGFEIQTDHFVLVIKPDLVLINKQKKDLAFLWILLVSADQRIKKKKKRKNCGT